MAGEFTNASHSLVAALAVALERTAAEIMLEADVLVPKDTETLRESARLFTPRIEGNRLIVEMGFGFGGAINPKTGNPVDQYTVPVHEIVEAKHAPPTSAKFLEIPLFAKAGRMESELAAELRIAWGKRLHTNTVGTRVFAFGGGYSVRDLQSGQFATL